MLGTTLAAGAIVPDMTVQDASDRTEDVRQCPNATMPHSLPSAIT